LGRWIVEAQFVSFLVGVALTVAVLALLGAAAVAFGADSRTPIGDDHGPRRRSGWT
jgi:hypothetical protein